MSRLPDGWKRINLGEFVTLQRGYDLPERLRNEGDIPVIGSSGLTGWHDAANVKGPGVTLGRSGNSFGVATYVPVDFWAHNTTMFVKNFHDNDVLFAFHFLDHFNFDKYNSGGAQPSLNRNFIYPIKILVPPLAEQRKIAQILSTWDEAIGLVEALIAALQRRKQGLMQRLLTGQVRFPGFDDNQAKPNEIPDDWRVVELGNIAFVTKLAGFEYTNHFDYSIGGEVTVIRGLNIKNGNLDLTDVHTIPKSVSDELPRSKLKKYDLVMGYVGTIGEVAMIDEDAKYHLAPNVAKISPDFSIIEPFYLLQQMYSERFQYELQILATTTSQPALSMTNLRKARVCLAPLEEQEKISSILMKVDSEVKLLLEIGEKFREQKKGLMQVLLTGEVRV